MPPAAGMVLSVLITNSTSPGIIEDTPFGLTSRLMYASSQSSLSPSFDGGENLAYPSPTETPQSISSGGRNSNCSGLYLSGQESISLESMDME